MGESEGGSEEEMIWGLIFAALVAICIGLYFVWRTQLEILRVLRLHNVKFLNAALFLRSEPETQIVPKEESKPN